MDLDKAIKILHAAGLVSHTPMVYIEIGNKVKALQQVGLTKTEAVNRVQKMTGKGIATIWRACSAVSKL